MNMILIIALSFGCFSTVLGRDVLPLTNNWMLQSSAKVKGETEGRIISNPAFRPDGWYPTSVPRTVLAALVDNKVFPDPYYGDNLKSIPGYRKGRWLVMPKNSPFKPPWWYRTEFQLPQGYKGKHLVLHLDGINYRANV